MTMPKGGARNRSGPPADPSSGRSDSRGFTLTTLPSTYSGDVPAFPLTDASEAEVELWEQAWTWPQANFWALPSETWRHRVVALWVRTFVRCEAVDAPASLLGQLHRFADQAALTTAGMSEVGIAVAVDEVRAKRAAEPTKPKSSRDRMALVKSDGA